MDKNSKRRAIIPRKANSWKNSSSSTKKYATQRDLSLAYSPGVEAAHENAQRH
jgi:malic enzyme